MKQSELEDKVRELFKRQGFEVEKEDNILTAENGQKLELKVFSSEEFAIEDIENKVEGDEKIFVDEELEKCKDKLDNDVSVLKEEDEDPSYEIPSYEVIGDIVVINDLAKVEEKEAIKGILHHHPSIETILLKEEGLSGEFRVGDYKKLYGEKTETIHKEHGCRYKVDPTRVYFSERFATERERVISQIEDGEKVLVMFAGIGPFSIMAARNSNPEKVVAIEKNPEGAKYLKENINLNNVEEIVEGIQGDVEYIVPDIGEFDRIIMPLPESANEFLELAFEHTNYNGVIHYYRFLHNEDWNSLIDEINVVSDITNSGFEVSSKTICGQRAANIDRVCIDIEIK